MSLPDLFPEDKMPAAKGRHLNPTKDIRPVEIAGADDAFAPAPEGCVCRDGAGYLRKAHELDGDGNCIFCRWPQAIEAVSPQAR